MEPRLYYFSLPHDLSGSMSKNRFRLELLWGVSRILDLMEEDRDFIMVFDYVCDIEVHFNDGFEFYQVKTRKNSKSYTTSALTKVSGEGSILGKLYALHDDNNHTVKLVVVSNVPYSSIKNQSLMNCFSVLPKTDKDKIENALKSELNIQAVDFSNLFYIQTCMNLENPENEIRGKLMVSFEKIKQCEPTNPNALYRLVVDTVQEKACYEYSSEDYDEILRLKGLTRTEFDKLLDLHADNARTGIQSANTYIESLSGITERRTYKKALPNVLKMLATSRAIKQIENAIAEYLLANDDLQDMDSAIDSLTEQFHGRFPLEVTNAEKVVFYIVIIKRFEEGVYDNEDDI